MDMRELNLAVRHIQRFTKEANKHATEEEVEYINNMFKEIKNQEKLIRSKFKKDYMEVKDFG